MPMRPLTLLQVQQATGARLITAHLTPTIARLSIDTRTIQPQSLFVALRAARDGHDFLPAAAAGGAVAALVDHIPDPPIPNLAYLIVPDTRKALGALARSVRLVMRSTVIAVAGSNGKTSTKHLIDAALATQLRGSISPKSFNNDLGIPLTIFDADPQQDYLVLEVGTNHPGEIEPLSRIASPDIALITNCGEEHLEGLVDLAGVRRENTCITDGLSPAGTLIVNGDDPDLLAAVARWKGRRITFGFEPHNDLFATDVTLRDDGITFRLNGAGPAHFVPMLGRHTAANALAALAVARELHLPDADALAGLAAAHGPDMRLQLQHLGNLTLLNDAYNANPASMRAALATLSGFPATGRRIAILGDMLELGDASPLHHRQIGQLAAQCNLALLIGVGEQAAHLIDAARRAGMSADIVFHYPSAADAADHLPQHLQRGDLVLLKASRGMRLETIANACRVGFIQPVIALLNRQDANNRSDKSDPTKSYRVP